MTSGSSLMSVLIVALAFGFGCGAPKWYTASAAGLPNPVLLGPVTHVGPPPPEPSVRHALGDRVSVSMWERDRYRAQTTSQRVTSGSRIQTVTRTDTYNTTRLGGEQALGFRLLFHLAPVHDPPNENGRWQEPYRATDVVRVERLRVRALTSTERSTGGFSRHGYTASARLDALGLTLANAHYYHLEAPLPAPQVVLTPTPPPVPTPPPPVPPPPQPFSPDALAPPPPGAARP